MRRKNQLEKVVVFFNRIFGAAIGGRRSSVVGQCSVRIAETVMRPSSVVVLVRSLLAAAVVVVHLGGLDGDFAQLHGSQGLHGLPEDLGDLVVAVVHELDEETAFDHAGSFPEGPVALAGLKLVPLVHS